VGNENSTSEASVID